MTLVYDVVAENEAALAALHDERLRYLFGLKDELERGEAVTRYLNALEEFSKEASAIREVAIYKLNVEQGVGAYRIGKAFGITKARAQQIIAVIGTRYPKQSQKVAALKRRVGRGT